MQNGELQVRILGNQPEPSLTNPGYEIMDFKSEPETKRYLRRVSICWKDTSRTIQN